MMPSLVEQTMLREALTKAAATESVSRKLGDELIEAAREVIAAIHKRDMAEIELRRAVSQLVRLVGEP
jgi:ribosomal protein S7